MQDKALCDDINNSSRNFKNAIEFILCGHLLLGMRLASRMLCIHSETPLETINFPFPSRYQLETATQFWMKAWIYAPFSALRLYPAETCAGPVHAATGSLSSCVCQFGVSRRLWFSAVFQPHWPLQSFCFLSCWVPWALRREISWRHPIKDRVFQGI